MGVAPRRFTESTVSGAPEAGPDENGASPARTYTATAVEDFAAADSAADDLTEEGLTDEDAAAFDPETDPGADPEAGAADPTAGPADGGRAPRQGFRRHLAGPERRRPMLILCAAFGVLVIALAAIAIKLGLGLLAQQRQQDDQQAAMHAARQAAADLMTVSYRSASSDINRIMGVATGSFRSQVSADRQQLIKETVSAHAVSNAKVLAAGLVGGQVNGNTATVVVVVDSTITSKNAPNGVVNHYRETITLNKAGGRWLASQVDFATPSGQ